ncbi:MAG: hypothetical protein NTU41_06885 [Chloroflexi bacterium]|nr:hypothetical protein [Chloroflexota bacterium]
MPPTSEFEKMKEDLRLHPEDWERVGEPQVEPATKDEAKGGTSVSERFRNKARQEIDRHRVYNKDGKVVHDHCSEPE